MPVKIGYDPDDVRFLIEDKKFQQHIVAKMMGVHEDTIWRWCKKHDIKCQKTGPRRGDQHPDWKGGTKMTGGYRYVYSPDHPFRTKARYVAEHRLVVERSLKRYLHPKEVVHHCDGNPLNNDPRNLVLFSSNADHLRHELKGKVPNWTPDGYERILKGCRLGGIRTKLKYGGGRRTQ